MVAFVVVLEGRAEVVGRTVVVGRVVVVAERREELLIVGRLETPLLLLPLAPALVPLGLLF